MMSVAFPLLKSGYRFIPNDLPTQGATRSLPMKVHLFTFKVRPSIGFPQADLMVGGYAHILVSPSYPDPEQEARDYLAETGYEVEEVRRIVQIDGELVPCRLPGLAEDLAAFGLACAIFGYEREVSES